MSTNRSSVAQIGLIACAAAILSGCQDITTPHGVSPVKSAGNGVSLLSSVASKGTPIENRYIVVLKDNSGDVSATSQRLLKNRNARMDKAFKNGLKGFAVEMNSHDAISLASDPAVSYIEQDQLVTIGVGRPTGDGSRGGKGGRGAKGGGTGTVTVPPDSGTQSNVPAWGIDRIDQTALPLSGTYTYSASGIGVHAYIIDAGIRVTHTEFGGRASADVDFVNDGYGATGCNWHGTHVAGIVGGATVGVAKGVRLHSVRVLDCNAVGSVSTVIAGIDWVVANAVLPAVINISISAGSSQALTDAVDRAVAAGITVVVAAGNDAADACNYSPANASSALTVSATTNLDQPASFSNTGPCVDIFAPGVQIASAMDWDDVSLEWGSGTSMAAPHVAGTVALYLQKHPAASPSEVSQAVLFSSTNNAIGGLSESTANRLLRSF